MIVPFTDSVAGTTIYINPDYVGDYEPYATSHDALDRDVSVQEEVRNAARALVEAVTLARAGRFPRPDRTLRDPRPK
ncbi:MAG: hypothetical protein AUH43_12975 [Acidobacteria bacterium 13_1_40CM_65_14]|nr:MAG: hypothetical protein AUH43_12975 [Acidobacteria bacterium 13_1_40CM_65_14]